MRIILQMYINENLGDDLFIDIIAKKYPDIEFIIFGIGNRLITSQYSKKYKNVSVAITNKYINKINTVAKVIFKRDFILEKHLKKSEGLITLGGSVFIDSPKKIESFKAKVLSKVRMHALKVKKPIFVIGANFGPIYHERFIKKYRDYFKQCISVCFRDKNSKDYFNELNNVVFAPDVIFNYNNKTNKINKKTVGISIIDLSDNSHSNISEYQMKYEEKIIEIINELSKQNYTINLYSFCNNQGDNKAIKRVLQRIENKKKINCLEYKELNIEEFIENFATNEFIIATRFHSMILGLINGQKVYPIIYDIKTKNVIEELKLSNYSSLETIEELKINDILEVKEYLDIKNIQKNAHMQFKNFEIYFNLRDGDKNE